MGKGTLKWPWPISEMAHRSQRSQHVGTLGPGTLRVRTKDGHIYINMGILILIWKIKNHGRSDKYVIHMSVLKSFSECAILIRKTPKALRPTLSPVATPTGGCPYLCSQRMCSSQNAPLLMFHSKNGFSQNSKGCFMRVLNETRKYVHGLVFQICKWVPNHDHKWVPSLDVHPNHPSWYIQCITCMCIIMYIYISIYIYIIYNWLTTWLYHDAPPQTKEQDSQDMGCGSRDKAWRQAARHP